MYFLNKSQISFSIFTEKQIELGKLQTIWAYSKDERSIFHMHISHSRSKTKECIGKWASFYHRTSIKIAYLIDTNNSSIAG